MSVERSVWIIGAGGIGLALAKKCKQLNMSVKVISRPEYDMTQLEEVRRFFAKVEQLPSIIVNTIGVLYDSRHMPEKIISCF